MHILVTGATGKVGSRFAPRLLQRGDTVRVLVRQAQQAEFLRRHAEQSLLGLHRSQGLGLRLMRLAFIYGEDDSHLADIAGWLRAWNPTKRLHMIHYADVAQGLMLALDTPKVDGQIYNAADDAPATTAELLTYLNEPVAQEAEAPPLADPWAGVVDTSRIKAELGFRPAYASFQAAREAQAL